MILSIVAGRGLQSRGIGKSNVAASKNTKDVIRDGRPVKAEKKSKPAPGFFSKYFKFSRGKTVIEPPKAPVHVQSDPEEDVSRLGETETVVQ